MTTYSALAAILSGLSSGMDNRRQRLHDDHMRQQQDDDRKRTRAAQNFDLARKLAPSLVEQNPEAAADLLRTSAMGLRDAGYDAPNIEIKGGLKEITRPDAVPGPMSLAVPAPRSPFSAPTSHLQRLTSERLDGAPSDYASMMTQGLNPGTEFGADLAPEAPAKVSVPDFNNPQTKAAISAGFGFPIPKAKVEVRPFGNGGLMRVTMNPDGTIETKVERQPEGKAPALVSDYHPDGTATLVPKRPGAVVHSKPAAHKPAKPTKPVKPHLVWARDAHGRQVRVEDKPGVVSEPAPKKEKFNLLGGGDAPATAQDADDAAFEAWLKKNGGK